MAFLKNIAQLRNIEWGKSFLWDFKIPDAPAPFNEFFPAIDIEETLVSLESFSFEAHNNTFKIPQKRQVKDVKITFVDDYKNSGLSFFTKWMANDIFKENEKHSTTATLQECAKQILIQKLPSTRGNALLLSSYLVYPEGPLAYRGNSDSGLLIHQVSLVIVATISVGERGD